MRQDENQLKAAAAESAAAQVTDGMIIGLGSGSTAALAVSALGRRVREGLRIVGIPTSESTAAQARALGIPLTSLADESQIDMTIDGADEVEEGSLNLIKGLGGALLREKIVASASKRLVIVIHDSKLVSRLAVGDLRLAGDRAPALGSGGQAVAASRCRWQTVHQRRRPLHPRLCVRADRLRGVVSQAPRSRSRPRGARPFHRIDCRSACGRSRRCTSVGRPTPAVVEAF